MLSLPMPFYGSESIHLPPVLEALEWADRQQFDAIHVHTPGPMGLCGWLVAKMLRVPLIATFNTDLPAYIHGLTGDYRMTTAADGYMQWFYNQADAVFSRSRSSLKTLEKLGIESRKLTLIPAAVDGERFSPAHRDADIWRRLGVSQTHKILYAGRVSVEKNLPLLAEAFRQLCACRHDAALIIAGDGPYVPQMRKVLAGLPAYFLGQQDDASLRTLYASSDLFAFPSRTDTMGQSVMEAQASGLPVLVSDEGGPREMMDEGLTGLVLSGKDAKAWTQSHVRTSGRRMPMPDRACRASGLHAAHGPVSSLRAMRSTCLLEPALKSPPERRRRKAGKWRPSLSIRWPVEHGGGAVDRHRM